MGKLRQRKMKSMSDEVKRNSPLLMKEQEKNGNSIITCFNLDILKVSIFQHQLFLGHPHEQVVLNQLIFLV